jgi:endonuclease YncB( thermonuclease family)
VLLLLLAVSPASADPCKAIPDRGAMPSYLGREMTFSGPVVHVGDGDSLCVAKGWTQDAWVEVRLADFYAPELSEPGGQAAKAQLARLTFGRRLTCTAGHRSYDRIVATCRLGGTSLADLLRRAGVRQGGRGAR